MTMSTYGGWHQTDPHQEVVVADTIDATITAGLEIDGVKAIRTLYGHIEAGGDIKTVTSVDGSIRAATQSGASIGQVTAADTIYNGIYAAENVGYVRAGDDLSGEVIAGLNIGTVLADNAILADIRASEGSLTSVTAGSEIGVSSGYRSSRGAIVAGENIGAITAGGIIQTPYITAGDGYIGWIASGALRSEVSAGQTIGTILSGSGVSGTITSINGDVASVQGNTYVASEISAGSVVGPIFTGGAVTGSVTAAGGSVGHITAQAGEISGNIRSANGVGNILAGSSLTGSVETTGEKGHQGVGHIQVGEASPGSITAAISVMGSIAGISVRAVEEATLPTFGATPSLTAGRMDDGEYIRQDRLSRPDVGLYTEGNIEANVTASGGIYGVLAHGRVQGSISAGASLSHVTAYKTIYGEIKSEVLGSSISTYGFLRGNVTIPGDTEIWAYDSILGEVLVSQGSVSGTTWGAILGNVKAHGANTLTAYDEIDAAGIASTDGELSAESLKRLSSNFIADSHAYLTSGGLVNAYVKTDLGDAIGQSLEDWEGEIRASANVRLIVRRSFEGMIDANGIMLQTGRDISGDLEATGEEGHIVLNARDRVSATIKADQHIHIAAGAVDSPSIVSTGKAFGDRGIASIDVYGFTDPDTLDSEGRPTVTPGTFHAGELTVSGNISIYARGDVDNSIIQSRFGGGESLLSGERF